MNKFEEFPYYVMLRTRGAEIKGLLNLTDSQKDRIMPVITLGHWRNSDGLDSSFSKIFEAYSDRPMILDLPKDNVYKNEAIERCLTSDDCYSNWFDLILSLDNIYPVVQIGTNGKLRDVIRQAIRFENAQRHPVFRISNYINDRRYVIPALASLDSPGEALVVIDAGYIRRDVSNTISKGLVASVVDTINHVRDEVPESVIVVASTSFPRSVMPFTGDSLHGEIPMLECDLYDSLGPEVAIYGDHGSIHSVVYDRMGGSWAPRVDYVKNRTWVFERRVGDNSGGFPAAAAALIQNFPEIEQSQQWGNIMISNTANHQEPAIKAPATNIAVRVNLHIANQLAYLDSYDSEDGEDDLDWL